MGTAIQHRPNFDQQLQTAEQRAKLLIVRTKPEYVTCGQFLVELRAVKKRIEASHKPGIDSAKAHLNLLKNQLAEEVLRLDNVIEIVEKKGEAWITEERRLAQVEQDRINAENARLAKIKAEADAAAAKKIAEENRRITVAQVRAALKAGEIGKREAARRLRAAGAEEEAAKTEAAIAAEEAKAAPPPKVQVKADVPVVSGLARRTNWKFRLENPKVFFAAVLADPGRFLEYIQANEVAMGDFVRRTKDKAKAEAAIPGIVVWDEPSI